MMVFKVDGNWKPEIEAAEVEKETPKLFWVKRYQFGARRSVWAKEDVFTDEKAAKAALVTRCEENLAAAEREVDRCRNVLEEAKQYQIRRS